MWFNVFSLPTHRSIIIASPTPPSLSFGHCAIMGELWKFPRSLNLWQTRSSGLIFRLASWRFYGKCCGCGDLRPLWLILGNWKIAFKKPSESACKCVSYVTSVCDCVFRAKQLWRACRLHSTFPSHCLKREQRRRWKNLISPLSFFIPSRSQLISIG